MPKDEQFYDQLIGYLARHGKVSEDAEEHVLVLSEFEQRPLPTPLRLHVTPETFGDHLRATETGGAEAHPDIHPREGAWRLFLVHLDEAVQAAGPGETELVLDGATVVSRPA